MTDALDTKGVAYVKWGQDDASGGMSYGVEARGMDVFLKVLPETRHDLQFSYIRAPLHGGDGPNDAQLLLVCPRCKQQLRIASPHKTFSWEVLNPPRVLNIPGNPDAMETVLVTVNEPLGCPACNLKFEVKENSLRAS